MKTFLKVIAGIIVLVVMLLLVLRITGLQPRVGATAEARAAFANRIPGLWLKGRLVTTPVTDWSFTDKYPTVSIQTHTRYLIPHSVTIFCLTYNGELYITAIHAPGFQYPHGKEWTEDVARDPHVRLKIGDQLFDRTLVHVTDPAEIAGVFAARSKKYPDEKVPAESNIYIYRVMPG